MNNSAPLVDFDEYQHAKAETSVSRLGIFNAFDLGRTEFPAIKFIVPGYLPEGATILAGRPKLGKSWLALDLALCLVLGLALGLDLVLDQGILLQGKLQYLLQL